MRTMMRRGSLAGMTRNRRLPRRGRVTGQRRRVVAYVRVSTDDQAESGLSLEAQRQRVAAWVTAQGDADLVDVVEDAGQSATTLDRPGLKHVLDMVSAGQVDTLLVVKLDRLTRRLRDFHHVYPRLQAAGVSLASVTDNMDTSTACGRLMLNVLLSFAEAEVDTTAERTREALRVLRFTGRRYSGKTRYGTRLDGDRVVEDRREVSTMNALKTLVEDGVTVSLSLRDVSRVLAEAGHLSRSGRPFTATQVARLLDRLEDEGVNAMENAA